jgi:hypothetical protein
MIRLLVFCSFLMTTDRAASGSAKLSMASNASGYCAIDSLIRLHRRSARASRQAVAKIVFMIVSPPTPNHQSRASIAVREQSARSSVLPAYRPVVLGAFAVSITQGAKSR